MASESGMGGAKSDGLQTLLEVWEQTLQDRGVPLHGGNRGERGDGEDRGVDGGEVIDGIDLIDLIDGIDLIE